MAQFVQQTTNANTPAVISTATALAANPARVYWHIQNLDTAALFVRFGAGASTSVYHLVLKGGTGAADGLGAFYSQTSGVVYTGIISVAAAGTPSYTVAEIAP